MAGIFVLTLLSFLLFYLLTRICWVRIIKSEGFKIEIHLPILSLHLINKSGDKENPKNKEKISFFGYFRIITDIIEKLYDCDLVIDRITLPVKSEGFSTTALLLPIGQRALVCSLVAYIGGKIKSLSVQDNAITLSPDIQNIHFNLTVKIRLFKLIYTFLFLRHRLKQENTRVKDKGYARE